MQAEDEFSVNGKQAVLSAPKEITLVRRKIETSSVLNLCYNLDIVGNIGGFSTTKPPANPKNSALKFDEIEKIDLSDITDMVI